MNFQDYEQKLLEYNSMTIEKEVEIANYYNIRQELESLGAGFRSYITKPQYLIPFLQPGRLVKVFPFLLNQFRVYKVIVFLDQT